MVAVACTLLMVLIVWWWIAAVAFDHLAIQFPSCKPCIVGVALSRRSSTQLICAVCCKRGQSTTLTLAVAEEAEERAPRVFMMILYMIVLLCLAMRSLQVCAIS